MKKVILIVLMLITAPLISGLIFSDVNAEENQGHENIILFKKDFSKPIIQSENDQTEIIIDEANSITTIQGSPRLPVFKKTFSFEWGTKIESVNVKIGDINEKQISDGIKSVPFFKTVSKNRLVVQDVYRNLEEFNGFYPDNWYSYDIGAGIDKKMKRSIFLTVTVNPIRYNPSEKNIEYINSVDMEIVFEKNDEIKVENSDSYDMVVITSDLFSDNIKPLIDHKNSYGLKTSFVTVEDIYNNFTGRDKPEKIKYFVKHAIDSWDIKYVFIVGDLKEVPTRSTDAYPWEGFGDNILSDLYYADVYDENLSFCSWDANGNNTFGEVLYEFDKWPPKMDDLDDVDLYPDVMIGRLPCRNKEEVDLLVQKIIYYEENTYDKLWFKKIIFAGGDTFPPRSLDSFNVFEGEITNRKVSQEISGFEKIFLWTSNRNLHFWSFNRAITKGAGFVSYAGHGFEHGWGTYPPNSVINRLIIYYTPFLQGIKNQHKLPIIFFDACLTAKLDFNMSDLDNYYPGFVKILMKLTGIDYDKTNYYPCFAYSFVNKEDGGAIATIGATRPAYTYVDSEGVYAGAGYLDVHFFKAYEEGVTVGQMFTSSQTDYLQNVGMDYFTIEEYMIIGDPSLKVGGYP